MGETDMGTLDKAGMAFKVVCSLVLSVGMLAFLPGIAAAQGFTGSADFCDDTSYDNANPPTPQTTGLFTDLHRGKGINDDYDNCVLNITGSVGSAGDMWITLLDSPGDPTAPPTFDCVFMEADVTIHKFDNRKAVGFVTNYDTETNTGLFWGLYDNGNTDGLTLSTFNGATGKLTGTVGTLPLGSKIKENVWYFLEAEVCNDGTNLTFAAAAVFDAATFTFIGELDIPDTTPLPDGISQFGQIGIAGQAKSAVVDSSVADFFWGEVD
jgi:hypothetical protein